MKKWLLAAVSVFFLLFLGKPAFAAVRCETQYGGTQICITTGQLQINKKVCDPAQGSCDSSSPGFEARLVDNLGINNHLFAPGEQVTFRLSIKNVGDANLGTVMVADAPQAGFFQVEGGSLNFTLTNLAPGETKVQDIKLRVLDSSQLPQSNVSCVMNTAEAVSDQSRDRDSAQICLERKVLGVAAELPRAGFEAWWFLILFIPAVFLIGIRLLRVGRMQ